MICPECEKEFPCETSAECWCSDFPKILEKSGDHCLCPSCLKVRITERITQYLADRTPENIKFIQSLGAPKQLIEGIDYYLNEAGLMVFTEWFHLRKGYCCRNDCLHCPYDK